jgi:hypothetical protein
MAVRIKNPLELLRRKRDSMMKEKLEEKADEEAKRKGLTLKQRNEILLKMQVEGILKQLGYKQFNKDTLGELIRQYKTDPSLLSKFGLTLDKIEQYQRKYSPEDDLVKSYAEGPEIQKSVALRRGGNVLVNRSINRRSKLM